MVGCGMRERGMEHEAMCNLNDWINGDAKQPRSRRLP